MGGDKDLIIQQEYQGSVKPPLGAPASKLDEMMYNEMVRLNKTAKLIKEILEG